MIRDYFESERRVQMLDSEQRQKWLRADDLIKEMAGITVGMTCVDLGCGTGAISFPLASAVGNEGRVYAVDNDAKAIGRIKEKGPPSNLIPVLKDAVQTGLESEIADFCFMVLILHEVEQPNRVMAEALRLLKPGGKVLVMEWRDEPDTPGPPHSERIPKEQMERLFTQAGLFSYTYTEWSRSHYVATGIKKKAG